MASGFLAGACSDLPVGLGPADAGGPSPDSGAGVDAGMDAGSAPDPDPGVDLGPEGPEDPWFAELPMDVSFGQVQAGHRLQRSSSFTNNSSGPLRLHIEGPGASACTPDFPGPFCVQTSTAPVPPGGRAVLSLGFYGEAPGPRVHSFVDLRIQDGKGERRRRLWLDGLPVAQVQPRCRIEPAQVSWTEDPRRCTPGARPRTELLCRLPAAANVVDVRLSGDRDFHVDARSIQAATVGLDGVFRLPFEVCGEPGPFSGTAEWILSGSQTATSASFSGVLRGADLVGPQRVTFFEPAADRMPSLRTLNLRNVGLEPAQPQGPIRFKGPHASEFLAAPPDWDALSPDSSTTMKVRFEPSPTARGVRRATLVLPVDNAEADQVRIELEGTAVPTDGCRLRTSDPLDMGPSHVFEAIWALANDGSSPCLVQLDSLNGPFFGHVHAAHRFGGDWTSPSVPGRLILTPGQTAIQNTWVRSRGRQVDQAIVELQVGEPDRPRRSLEFTFRSDLDSDRFTVATKPACDAHALYLNLRGGGLLTGAQVVGGAWDVQLRLPPLPAQIDDLDGQGLWIAYQRPEDGDVRWFDLELELELTDGTPFVVQRRMVAPPDPAHPDYVDSFIQIGRPKVDHLFVVDDSGSMEFIDRASLLANLHAHVEFLQAQGMDARVAWTTPTDLARGAWFGPNGERTHLHLEDPEAVSNYLADLADRLPVQPPPGSGTERILDAILAGIDDVEQHLLRPEAVWSLTLLTNESDLSDASTAQVLNALLEVKGFRNTQLFAFNVICGGQMGCVGPGGRAAPAGHELLTMSENTGGVWASICTADWSRTLEDLSRTAFGFNSRFFLTHQPVIDTLRVFVDDTEISDREDSGRVNWNYDFSTNSINFSPLAVPGPGSETRVEYTIEGVCR